MNGNLRMIDPFNRVPEAVEAVSKDEVRDLSAAQKLALANAGRFVSDGEGGWVDRAKVKQPTPLAPVQVVVIARNALHARRLRRSRLFAG